jgi:oxygen-independent coproporphyrinogen-3 oxidase
MAAQHPRADGIALYVHVPFCLSKCPYCDFNTYQGIESQFGDYLSAVTAELSAWARVLDRPNVNTVFLGGGTPSYLPDGDVARILDAIAGGYAVRADAEITAECNPNDLTPERCADLRAAGVNRVSIGVQSMDNGLLAMLGRRHDADEAAEALQRCRSAGFDNVNLDLMYGLPRQSLKQWRDTVARTVGLGPEHLSLYALTLEEGTPLRRWVEQGRLPEPDPDAAADMYDLARSALADAGYRHYEISNWSRPGQESEHNLAYWRNLRWLGVGPGAHSALGDCRFWTVRRPREYARRAAEWAANALASSPWEPVTSERIRSVATVDDLEIIDPDTAAAETMFLGLRLLEGMDLATVSTDVCCDLATRYRREIQDLVGLGLLEWDNEMLRLTKPTYLIANQVFTRFVA